MVVSKEGAVGSSLLTVRLMDGNNYNILPFRQGRVKSDRDNSVNAVYRQNSVCNFVKLKINKECSNDKAPSIKGSSSKLDLTASVGT